MSKLGFSLPLHPIESLAGYCSRTAALHKFESASALGNALGFSFQGVRQGDTGAIDRLAELLPVARGDLENAATTAIDKRTWLLNGHSFTRKFLATRKARFCPICLHDDETIREGRRGVRGYFRRTWLSRFVRACPVHNVALREEYFSNRQLLGDPYASLVDGLRGWERYISDCHHREATAAQAHFIRRFNGEPTEDNTWLDTLPLQPAFHFVEMIGAIQRHGIEVRFEDLTAQEQHASANEGYQIAAGGAEQIRDFLVRLTAGHKRSKSMIGAHAVYGEMADQVLRLSEIPGYDTILVLLQETAVDTLPIGPGDRFLGNVRHRRLHTINSAAKEAGIGSRLLWRYLHEANLVDHWLTMSQSPFRTFIPVEIIKPYVVAAVKWAELDRAARGR